jgi:outer membrane protein TolC
VRQRILRDVRAAFAQLEQSRTAADAWRDQMGPRHERHVAQAERAYGSGEVPYLFVLEASRRLNEGRLRELEARTAARRAIARLEQSVGRNCGESVAR